MPDMPSVEAYLQAIFEKPLPGRKAQEPLAPLGRTMDIPPNARKAVVLMIVLLDTERVVFIRRSISPNDRHSGQISLPGGKVELEDPSLEAAVLRETKEEVGIAPEHVRIHGQLTSLYIPISRYHVYPFVGTVAKTPVFSKQDDEVDEVLLLSLGEILTAEVHERVPVKTDYIKGAVAPAYIIENQIIWGATAMMLAEFQTALKNIL